MKNWKAALGLAVFSVVIRLPLLDAPLDRDEGSLACFALGLLDGRLPYRDFTDIKPPLLYPAYLPMALAGGASPALFRLAAAFWNALSTILLWRLGARIAGEKTGLLAAVLFAAFTADPSAAGFIISPEFLSHLPVIGAMLLFHSALREGNPVRSMSAGLLMGAAICIKQQALPLSLIVFLAPGYRRGFHCAGGFISGILLTGTACALGLAITGLFWPALDSASWGAVHIMGAIPASGIPHALAAIFGGAIATQSALWLASLTGFSDRRIPARDRIFILAWLLLAAAGIAMGRRPYPYYLQMAIPPLSLAGGIGIARLLHGPVKTAAKALRLAVAGLALFGFVRVLPLFTVPREVRALALHPDNNFYEAEKVAEWLAINAPKNAPVFIAGSELEIAFQAGLKFAGRCPLPYLMTVASPDSGKVRKEWLRGVMADSPGSAVYCRSMKAWGDIYSDRATTENLRKSAMDLLEGPGWMLAASIPPFDIYLRKH